MADRRILLVEDNPDDEALTLRALKKHNILNKVTVAHDGAEAVEILFADNGAVKIPALILLDLKLPKVDGLEVLRRIRAESTPGTSPLSSSPAPKSKKTSSTAITPAPMPTSASQ